jgi:hypothetical protein
MQKHHPVAIFIYLVGIEQSMVLLLMQEAGID